MTKAKTKKPTPLVYDISVHKTDIVTIAEAIDAITDAVAYLQKSATILGSLMNRTARNGCSQTK